jgi:hypothetical protein
MNQFAQPAVSVSGFGMLASTGLWVSGAADGERPNEAVSSGMANGGLEEYFGGGHTDLHIGSSVKGARGMAVPSRPHHSISFAPLQPDAVAFLEERTGINYRHCDFSGAGWFCCTVRDGDIKGVFIAEFMNAFDAHITCAIDDPRFLTRRLVKAVFAALFSQAVRLTALTRPENAAAIRILKHLGFSHEGICRLGIEGRWDALTFGLLRSECRWIGE